MIMNFKEAQQEKVSGLVQKLQQRKLIERIIRYAELNIEEHIGDRHAHAQKKELDSGDPRPQSVTKQRSKVAATLAGIETGNTLTASAVMTRCACPAKHCITLKSILDAFKAPLNEEQAWALIYQYTSLYRKVAYIFSVLELPQTTANLSLHRDGSVHFTCEPMQEHSATLWRTESDMELLRQRYQQTLKDVTGRAYDLHVWPLAMSRKMIRELAVLVYAALDYNLQADEQYQMSSELEELITYMIAEEEVNVGGQSDDINGIDALDYVLDVCRKHVTRGVPEAHYKAVCRALVIEAIELRLFLTQIYKNDAESAHLATPTQAAKADATKRGFTDWARFWVQVNDEVRNGVQLRKRHAAHAPLPHKLTPYETLMKDIRAQKYKLRKVLKSDDIPLTDTRLRAMRTSALAKGLKAKASVC